jgi:DNA-binding ferritin-like protein (Dps family)
MMKTFSKKILSRKFYLSPPEQKFFKNFLFFQKKFTFTNPINLPEKICSNNFPTNNQTELSTSPLRVYNIGKNYFRYINPKRKKILMTLLNSYIKQFQTKESQEEMTTVLDLFYNGEYKGKKFSSLASEDFEYFSESILWHLNALIILDRIASQYTRYEFFEYDQVINSLNEIPKEKRNKAKYVFTNQPNQPNCPSQMLCISELFKGLEENDLDYLDMAMKIFYEQNLTREFKRSSVIEELITNHSSCIPDLINSFSSMYDLGLRELSDYFEIPETCLIVSSDIDSDKFSLITYLHGLNINFTIDQYVNIITEAQLENDMREILECFSLVKEYASKLMEISDTYRSRKKVTLSTLSDDKDSDISSKMSKTDFFQAIPVMNIAGVESHIDKLLKQMINCNDHFHSQKNKNIHHYKNPGSSAGGHENNCKISEVAKKLHSLFSIFKLVGVLVQIKFDGELLKLKNESDFLSVNDTVHDILKEITILNTNVLAGELIVFDYDNHTQYEIMQKLLLKYQANNIELVPMIKSSTSNNETNSNITLISAGEARTKEGLLQAELRNFKEYRLNPNKWIYMWQGNTAERGGGPFGLTHQKYDAMTRIQRQRHIRTIQGYYFTSEFCSKDLIFTFLVNGAQHLNIGDHFEPTAEYIDFLYELDTVIGVPQREMIESKEFSDMYLKNQIVKTLVENFDYAGSEDKSIVINSENNSIQNLSPIVQSYIFSDRCSFTHPELAFWDRLDENLIKKMAKNYYDNNRHIKYILYNYAFMLKRFDLEFAQFEVGFEESNGVFQNLVKGRNALEKIMNNIGLSKSSTAAVNIYNQHLGLLTNSSTEETEQKFDAYRMLYLMQNYFVRKYLREVKIGNEEGKLMAQKKMRILQSTLANISTFNGKG